VAVSPNTFSCPDIGVHPLKLSVRDAYGNTSTCTSSVTVDAPIITSGTLTGLVVDPIPVPVLPADDLIEVTACPGGIAIPKDIQLTLNLDGSSTITPANIVTWQISEDEGATWIDVAGTAGLTQHTLLDLLSTTLVRIVFNSGNCVEYSPLAVIRFLPPDQPPIITNVTSTLICLGDSVSITAESFYENGGQFSGGGQFNEANPDGWAVDGIEGDLNASGNNTNSNRWKETNGPAVFGNLRYDTTDNTKFGIANGPRLTTLETPIFNTVGMTPSEAILEFYQAYYFCSGAEGKIELSLDGGTTYDIVLTTDQSDNYIGPNDSGFAWNGNNCGNGPNGKRVTSDPLQFASIDLSAYVGMANLRIQFTFDALGVSSCTDNFPVDPGYACTVGNTNETVVSSWVIDDVGFPYAIIDEELEWTDENNTVVATGNTVSVTPVTPGLQEYGVTALVNGCRADTDDGTEFVTIETSLAYAGQDFAPVGSDCGQSTINLNAYDNTLTAVQNFDNGAWETGLYTVPDVSGGDNDYLGTGVTGAWSIMSSTTGSCGSTETFSSLTNPSAIFTAEPGTYTLRWTLSNGCFDEIDVTINSCVSIDFDGSDDFVSLRNNYAISGAFSIENWVKPNAVSGISTIFSKRNVNVTNRGYNLNIENGILKFYWFSASGNGSIESQYAISTDRWYHVAVTFDGATYLLYVDGVSVGSVSGVVNAPGSTSANVEALIGALDASNASNNTVVNNYHGWIDEVKIWNTALTASQLHQMMNQEIDNNTAVRGAILQLDIAGLSWANLEGYYRMNVDCGYLNADKGARGRLRNMSSSQQQTAPLPYTSLVDNQDWSTDNTWTNFPVWDAPNSVGIDGVTPIDWNIVRISHDINSGDKDITVLGLISDTPTKELTMTDPLTTQDETNNGQGLRVTHYLRLDGSIDLVGESQLLQDEGSILDEASSGRIERDQQGTSNLYNYNYFSSPVTLQGAANNSDYALGGILRDGTNTNENPLQSVNWTTAHDANPATDPITISSRWLYTYADFPQNSYSDWSAVGATGGVKSGLGFTMKGSGAATAVQNYVFEGKPNNGTIINTISSGFQAMVGNPYPSSIDANEFIDDNGPLGTGSIDGTLYFWEHFVSNATHYLEEYEGGYAAYNKIGGLPPYIPIEISGDGSFSKTPGRYIPVGQGFFITASATGGNVNFYNDQRSFVREQTGTSVFMEANDASIDFGNTEVENTMTYDPPQDNIQKVRIEFITPDEYSRPLLLGFVPDGTATDGIDYGYDAALSDVFDNDMCWIIEDQYFSIQGVGAFDALQQFPLGLFVANQGVVKIKLQDLENFDEELNVFIYDELYGTYAQINTNDYEIALDAGEYLNRFYLAFTDQEALSVPQVESSNIILSYLNESDEVYLNTFNKVEVKTIQLLNILGQEVMLWSTIENKNGIVRIPIEKLAQGNYIIRVNGKKGEVITKKVIIE
jgi:hypothetical protein